MALDSKGRSFGWVCPQVSRKNLEPHWRNVFFPAEYKDVIRKLTGICIDDPVIRVDHGTSIFTSDIIYNFKDREEDQLVQIKEIV